jgi:hypothetical protein
VIGCGKSGGCDQRSDLGCTLVRGYGLNKRVMVCGTKGERWLKFGAKAWQGLFAQRDRFGKGWYGIEKRM